MRGARRGRETQEEIFYEEMPHCMTDTGKKRRVGGAKKEASGQIHSNR